jgi:hypothetical protein
MVIESVIVSYPGVMLGFGQGIFETREGGWRWLCLACQPGPGADVSEDRGQMRLDGLRVKSCVQGRGAVSWFLARESLAPRWLVGELGAMHKWDLSRRDGQGYRDAGHRPASGCSWEFDQRRMPSPVHVVRVLGLHGRAEVEAVWGISYAAYGTLACVVPSEWAVRGTCSNAEPC